MDTYKGRPKTAVLSTRADIRSIATLAAFYESKGVRVTSRSNLLYIIIEDYSDLLVKKGLSPKIDSTVEAMQILSSLSLQVSSMQTKGANRKELLKQISLEDIVAESTDPAYLDRKKKSGLTDKEIEEAVGKIDVE